MKILFTGGGSGGHFYPIVAVAEAFNELRREKKLVKAELYYMAPTPYNEGVLFDNNIKFIQASAGKMRRYFSLLNVFDIFKTIAGIFKSIWKIFNIYPDVVFGKGGYASFPALFAARIFRIPVVIHESDTVPGRVNKWAGKFAERVAVSYPEAAHYFSERKVAHTGNPVRRDLFKPYGDGAHDFLKLEKGIPTIFVVGGSQGAVMINDAVLGALPKLVDKFNIIHQVGLKNAVSHKKEVDLVLESNPHSSRYKIYEYLDTETMKAVAQVSDVAVSRAGSMLFEIASWGTPSIIIPITESNGDHQRKNAFSYARAGACVVIEEKNLTPNILFSEIVRLMDDPLLREEMKKSAQAFFKPNAAKLIAEELYAIASKHE